MGLCPADLKQLGKYKLSSVQLSSMYYGIGNSKRAERVRACCDEAYVDNDGNFIRTYFCDDRWCHVCAYKRTKYIFGKISYIVKHLVSQGYHFGHHVITVPNVKGEFIRDTINKITKAYRDLYGNGALESWKKLILATFRSFEVTYNQDTNDWHIHLHCLVLLSKSYSVRNNNYLSYNDIRSRWLQLTQFPLEWYQIEDPSKNTYRNIHCDNFWNKQRKYTNDLEKACSQVAKYACKPEDLQVLYDKKDYKNFRFLVEGFAGTRKFDLTGKLFKRLAAEFDQLHESNFHFIQLELEDKLIPCTKYTYNIYGYYEEDFQTYFYNSKYRCFQTYDYWSLNYYYFFLKPHFDNILFSLNDVKNKFNI